MTIRPISFGVVMAAVAIAIGGCASEPRSSYWVPLNEYRARHGQQVATPGLAATAHRSKSRKRAHTKQHKQKSVASYREPVPARSPDVIQTNPQPTYRAPHVGPRHPAGGMVAKEVATTMPARNEPELSPREQASDALARVRDSFGRGQVLAARQIIISLFGARSGEVSNQILMLEMGRTYDPWYLGQLPMSDAAAEPMQAQYYYEEAKLLGSVAAASDLQRILGRAASNKKDSSGEGAASRPEIERKSPTDDSGRGGR